MQVGSPGTWCSGEKHSGLRREQNSRRPCVKHWEFAAAAETGNSILPVLMCVCIAASAALLTPVATPVNLIAMGAAGYKFGDYWKLGLVVMAVFFVVAIVVVPIFWPFT